MRLGWILGVAIVCLLGSLALGGTAPLGRVLLSAGQPGLAAQVFRDPGWRGVALYRSGDMSGAAESFRDARMMLNLGNAQVYQGDYAAALEAYDVARMRGDDEAAANFNLVSAYYAGLALDPDAPLLWESERDPDGPKVESGIAKGNARAASTGSDTTNAGALIGLPELDSRGRVGVRKVFDDKFMVANTRWLSTLQDVPGDYLAARILHEFKRRNKLGLTPPDPEDPS
ncbi:tetratricopeptide repeat protein [Puniceibacterium sp. IMCC21224]|uniref:tetratricopeptide repeat protein n=1 Tax=Puniceibacterium sp. IMCC21224 TaxID=1618204 RepID=UPI00064E0701|nr:tetratricopeptide repeat protein [Puniceibacterium sp. IMCC21224]KMK65185.1 tetratricopeptide repeat protein [Puniceibacterium sp. IMCC21224]